MRRHVGNIADNRKMLHLADWGAPHGQCIKTDLETFKAYMADFLDR